jgi:transposase
MDAQLPFSLESKIVGPLPIVNHFLTRLGVDALLKRHLAPTDGRTKVAPSQILGLLVRNLVLARQPLYAVPDWAEKQLPGLLGLTPEQIPLVNDDRIGRALERLFDADRQAMMTDLVVGMAKEFDLSLEELHNDSTTLSVHGEYAEATGRLIRGQSTVYITFGHSKDHRPDLKQLLWILTVSADGAVPVHFKVTDGNTEDSTTHIETWEVLRQVVGSAKFLYVADSKLCTRQNLKHIDQNGGWFVTVMPQTRSEDQLFKDWLQDHAPQWTEVIRRPHPRRKDGPPDVISALSSPIPDGDGFRLIWYQSTHKMERDAQSRRDAIQRGWKDLQGLQMKLQGSRSRVRSKPGVVKLVDEILRESGAERWIRYAVQTVEVPEFRQEKRGRPGRKTRYRRQIKRRFELTWQLRQDRVDYDARCDGVFPLITNCPPDHLSAAQVLKAYKCNQPLVEKRHHLLKNVQSATPVYLQNVARIEALLFAFFVSLLVHALIERELRNAMGAAGQESVPLYPEERECEAPTAQRALEIFNDLQRHLLIQEGNLIQRFDPTLTAQHTSILELLQIPTAAFCNL